jgi:hypothetical protein
MTIQKTPLILSWILDLQIDTKYTYLLREYAWSLSAHGRPITGNLKRKCGGQKLQGFSCVVLLHQLIMYLEYGEKSDMKRQVCHKNHDFLDNRLENLRFDSARGNKLDHVENTGVNPTQNGKWKAQAKLGSKIYCGSYRELREDAQFDYDTMVAMYDYHGILPKTKQRDLPKHITYSGNNKRPYRLSKKIAGRTVLFGCYPSVEDATKARDEFITKGWVK